MVSNGRMTIDVDVVDAASFFHSSIMSSEPWWISHAFWSSVSNTLSKTTYTDIWNGLTRFFTWSPSEEEQFLILWQDVLESGRHIKPSMDHKSVPTYSVFGRQVRFSLRDVDGNHVLPVTTVRKMPIRHVFEELLWMLQGHTDNSVLTDKKVNIWTPNASQEFLTSRGLNYPKGQLGPVYGHQLRRFGASFNLDQANQSNQGEGNGMGEGVDQIAELEQLIRTDPNSRRMILTTWNPCDLKKVALPSCHILYQFRVVENTLSCHMYQRSSDTVLAGMWNVTFTALLTHLLAHSCGLSPGDVIVSYGDVHIYENQIEAAQDLCGRRPRGPPLIRFKVDPSEHVWDYRWKDLEIVNYQYDKDPVKIPMNA